MVSFAPPLIALAAAALLYAAAYRSRARLRVRAAGRDERSHEAFSEPADAHDEPLGETWAFEASADALLPPPYRSSGQNWRDKLLLLDPKGPPTPADVATSLGMARPLGAVEKDETGRG